MLAAVECGQRLEAFLPLGRERDIFVQCPHFVEPVRRSPRWRCR